MELPATMMMNDVSIKTWEVALENDTAGKNITVYYDNIVLTNSDGRIQNSIYSRGPLEYTAPSSYAKNYENYSVSIEKERITNKEINTKITKDRSPDISSNGRKVVFSSYDGHRRYRLKISEAPSGYTVKAAILDDTAKGIYDTSMSNGDDFRIIWQNYDTVTSTTKEVDLDRYLEKFTPEEIVVWFKIQETAGWSGGLSNYYVEYSRNKVGLPPTDYTKVYKYYDDFNEYFDTSKWTLKGKTEWQSDGTVKLPNAENSATGNGFYSADTFSPGTGTPGIGILMYMKTEYVTSEIRLGLSNSDFTNSFVFASDDLDQYLQERR